MSEYTFPLHVVCQRVGEEMVILNTRDGQYYGLNEVGTRFLELLRRHGERAAVLAHLEREFDASPETLARDTAALLERLEKCGLIERVAE